MGVSWAARLVVLLVSLGATAPINAQTTLHDPNLPTVKSESLRQLIDTRDRLKIMAASQARFNGRCVCPYMTRDADQKSCKGRHEVIKVSPRPICYMRGVTDQMVSDWRRRHPDGNHLMAAAP